MKYYYFHGYKSSPMAEKANAMRQILGHDNVFVPDFNLSAEEISDLFDSLCDEISSSKEEVCIVGSSLGGLFALYVASRAKCNVILLNPALIPIVIIPKVTDNIDVNAVVMAQKLSLYAYEHYDADKTSVWVTDDSLINHDVLTKPYFYKGVKEYKKFDKSIAFDHQFIGFKDVFEKYIQNNG